MHPRILVLNERYKGMAKEIGAKHFRFSRLRENIEEESKAPPEKFEPLLSGKRERRLKWVGDKGHNYAMNLQGVSEKNPGCVFMLTLRDPVAVAASAIEKHQRLDLEEDENIDPVIRCVKSYNKVLGESRQFVRKHSRVPFVIVEYESFFRAPMPYEPLLSGVLGLNMRKTAAKWKAENQRFAVEREEKPISEENAERVRVGIDLSALDWLRAYGIGQRRAARLIG